MRIADVTQGKSTQGRKVQNSVPPSGRQTAANQSQDGATVAISAEGMGLAQKNKEEGQTAIQEAMERKMYQEMLENANEAAKAQGEGFGDLAKALEIARRILNGDIVPRQDEQFLMEFNSEIYMRVKSMAKAKEDPKEYDTLMEDEEDEGVRNKKSGENAGGGVRIESSGAGEASDAIEEGE